MVSQNELDDHFGPSDLPNPAARMDYEQAVEAERDEGTRKCEARINSLAMKLD